MLQIFKNTPHRRWNPLRGDWVLISPQRTQRPWQGQTEDISRTPAAAYDPACYLCPGNVRAGGQRTRDYTDTYVFENDFAALKPDVPRVVEDETAAGLLKAETEGGVCRVLCFSPQHDLTLATMGVDAIARVVHLWAAQEAELAARPDIRYVQIFENRGAMMGASNPHPHGQIWATEHVPNEPTLESAAQKTYFQQHGSPLLSDYLSLELKLGKRVVAENNSWVAVVPFWAVWPFELLLLPRGRVATMRAMDVDSRTDLAKLLKIVTAGYNLLYDTPFPYSMGFHAAPCDGPEYPEWQLHAHFYPPLAALLDYPQIHGGF